MPRPYFVADQATVTVLKPVASSAFGSYKLSVPEDVDINDIHEFAAPGNELGYVASLAPAGQRVGGFARRFVRADVSVTAADTKDPDWVPSSDVDKVLTEAAARVEGDFFLESDITKAGLGPWIPFTHFEQGDLATVEIWGRRVPLPVTRIEPKVTDHDENDWSVHVGGQVLTDDEARLAENETLRQAAVQSRREVAGLESQTAKAVSTADAALEAVGDNREYVDEQLAAVRSSIADSGVYLENVKQYVAEGRQHAESAAAMAAQAGEMATRAEQIYASMDPLRDDVESIHAEVSRLGLLAAGHAQQAAEEAALGKTYVESAKTYAQQALEQAQAGEQHVADAGVQATAAQEYAARAQQIVDDAQAVLDGTNADAQAARDALEEAQGLLNDVDGNGTSLTETLAQVVTMHQEVLETHSDILDAHRDVLEKHGQAIRWAAMAASQASAAAQSASQAAQDALRASSEAAKAADDAATAAGHANRAAEENAKAIVTLGQADEKLKEADRKLQAQIDETRKAGELLAQAVKILAAGVAANSAASQSALMAADENRKATQATNVAVETLTEVQKETSRQATTAEQVSKDAKAAAGSAQTASKKALQASVDVVKSQQLLEDTQLVQGNAIFWQEVHRTRVFHKYSMTTTDTYGGVMTITPIDSQQKMQMDFAGNWGGRVLVEARMTDAWGNNSRVDFFSYDVAPGSRRLIVEPEVVNYGVNRMHITIEQWWPNAAMEFVFLPNGSGGWQKPQYEDSIYGGVNYSWLSEGIMTVLWVRSKPYVATRDVMASPDYGTTWQMYRAGSVLPKTGASNGFSFTWCKPVSGESRPVQLIEQL